MRRRGNAYVNDARNYFTVWANYSSEPAAGATTGTFNIIPPEMTDPETTFLTNNINIGIDNIFENTNSHLHANNIERIDYIVPTGLRPGNQTDLDGTGVLVMDRGSGDPFKIAAILSLDASNQPASYGPPVAVSSTHFGPTLLPASANYCALTKDPKFGTTGRPSSPKSQNIAGVILTLSDLGVAIGQRIYGYSIVDVDVNVMNTDWTTYPNDTDSTAVLDPASVFGFYKTAGVILASSNTWKLSNYNGKPLLRCSVEPALQQGSIQIERSVNGQTFENIYSLDKPGAGEHSYLDPTAPSGRIFYRLKFIGASGQVNYSGVESILIPVEGQVQLSPNPCKDRITVTFPVNWQKQTVHATLLTSDGRTIQDQQFAATCSKDLLFNCPSNGSYYLKIENKTSGEVQLLPVLVIK